MTPIPIITAIMFIAVGFVAGYFVGKRARK